jgi:hypothetical protein
MGVALTYNRSDACDEAAKRLGVERLDARTVRKVIEDPLDLFP